MLVQSIDRAYVVKQIQVKVNSKKYELLNGSLESQGNKTSIMVKPRCEIFFRRNRIWGLKEERGKSQKILYMTQTTGMQKKFELIYLFSVKYII